MTRGRAAIYNNMKRESEAAALRTDQARRILELLLDGVNPVTGECLDDEHVCMQPLVMRALHVAIEALGAGESALPQAKMAANRPWTQEDDDMIAAMHESGRTIEEICAAMQRRPRSLRRRMEALGLIEAENAGVRPGLERYGAPWLAQEEQRLADMHRQGMQPGDIARELRRTEYSIRCRMEKLGLIEAENDRN